VTAKTKHPDEAFELVKWLASGEFMAQNAVTIGAASPRDDLADVQPYSEEPQLLAAEKQLNGARSFPPPEGTDKMQQVIADATEAVITKRMSGEEAAAQLAEQAKQLLGPDKILEQ
jgi:multiple sugar transport system substrate-binding protein